ncbi:MAG: LysE family transporter [Negativicutes bacterium]|jgi:L-lysine exporter family protein LysE/ArgO
MYYIQGLLLGIAYVVPIGLQNIYVINAALRGGWRNHIITILIVSFMDISLATACFLGLGALIDLFSWLKVLILFAGFVMLLIIGVKLIRASVDIKAEAGTKKHSFWSICRDLFVVTWLNPHALIDGSILFGTVNAGLPIAAKNVFFFGMCSASLLWFAALTVSVALMRHLISAQIFTVINKICGVVIIVFALKFLWEFIVLMNLI